VTLVAMNAADFATEISKQLLQAGRPAETPVLITRAGATTAQRSLVTTLKDVAATVKAAKQTGNGMLVIGEPAASRSALSWFESKPLFGWRVLLPTTKDSFDSLVPEIEALGASVTRVPTLSVEPPRTPQQMDRAITGLVSGRFEWVVFTCANSVKAVWEKCQEYGLDARAFAGIRLAASGDGTNAQLAEYGIRADVALPDGTTTSALLDEFPAYDERTDPINRVFLPRADIATESLAAGLVELGWEVEDITAYRTVRAAPPAPEIRDAIKAGGFDAVLFTSSATVRNLVGIAGKPHQSTLVCAIGPQTEKTCVEHGLNPTVLATDPTPHSLLEALADRGNELRDAAVANGETEWRPTRRRGAGRRKVTT
jgi:uroporphyrinogen III methyltransferase/synthase